MAVSMGERAFQLAREGECVTMGDLVRTLERERWEDVDADLGASTLRLQLRTIMMETRLKRFGRTVEEAG